MQTLIIALGLFILAMQFVLSITLLFIWDKLRYILKVMKYLDDTAKQEAIEDSTHTFDLTIYNN